MEQLAEGDLRRRLDGVTAELLAAYEELDVLSTVAEIAGAVSDVAVAGHRILEEAAKLLEADVAFIFYTDQELRGEEPPPIGVNAAERDALAKILSGWLSGNARPTVMAPFQEGAGVPHAPDAMAAVPLRCEGQVLGAICLGRWGDGATFAAGDLKILAALAASAAAVLLQRKNLDLSRLTRRLEDRNKLLKGIFTISGEIASSLDLDRLLHAISNLSARVLGFDRCAVLLDIGARRRLRAVSGVRKLDRADPELSSLERLLDWVAGRGVPVTVDRVDSSEPAAAGADPGIPATSVSARPAEAADQAVAHMNLAGARSFLALPLADDQGLLGVLSFESETAGFVDETRLEGARILANQATVALRNARLYSDVPLIGLLRPIRRGMAKARSLPRRRAALWIVGGLIAVALLVMGRWEMRVPGRALVMPSRVLQVSARVRGVIREIGSYAEGDRVARGDVLARRRPRPRRPR